jgi:hypothetical protein
MVQIMTPKASMRDWTGHHRAEFAPHNPELHHPGQRLSAEWLVAKRGRSGRMQLPNSVPRGFTVYMAFNRITNQCAMTREAVVDEGREQNTLHRWICCSQYAGTGMDPKITPYQTGDSWSFGAHLVDVANKSCVLERPP